MARANLTKLVLAGHLSGGDEFNVGFWFDGVSYVGQEDLQQCVGDFITNNMVGSPWLTTFRSILAADSHYDAVKAYFYPVLPGDALYQAEGVVGAAQGVGTAPGNNADQISVCASLKTGVAGRSFSGRSYLPANGLVLTSGAVIDPITVDALGNAVVLMLSAWNDSNEAFGHDPVPVVNSPTKNVATPVNSIVVDDRADVQRRRANRQAIPYRSSHAYPIA